jgi:hypothetical protein
MRPRRSWYRHICSPRRCGVVELPTTAPSSAPAPAPMSAFGVSADGLADEGAAGAADQRAGSGPLLAFGLRAACQCCGHQNGGNGFVKGHGVSLKSLKSL